MHLEWAGETPLADADLLAEVYRVSTRSVRRHCEPARRTDASGAGTGYVLYDAYAAGDSLAGISPRRPRSAAAIRAALERRADEPADTAAGEPDGYVDGDALLATGLTYRKLDYWTRQGWLRPVQASQGSGYPRRWPVAERDVAAMMNRLVDAGLHPARAHDIARAGGTYELAPGIRVTVEPQPSADTAVAEDVSFDSR